MAAADSDGGALAGPDDVDADGSAVCVSRPRDDGAGSRPDVDDTAAGGEPTGDPSGDRTTTARPIATVASAMAAIVSRHLVVRLIPRAISGHTSPAEPGAKSSRPRTVAVEDSTPNAARRIAGP